MDILVTNDDGVAAGGVRALGRALEPVGRVTIVAPDRERSGTGHSLTLRRPLHVHWLEERVASVDGTPTDCVLLAVHDLLGRSPDILVSGINHGANLGDDVTYSGTVAAAFEGTLLGIPSLAISLAPRGIRDWEDPRRFEVAAPFARKLVENMHHHGLPPGILLNVNVPDLAPSRVKGARWTRLGKRIYLNAVRRQRDASGEMTFEIGGEVSWVAEEGTDFAALAADLISLTPIHLDLTDYTAMAELGRWDLAWRDRAEGAP